MKGLGEKFQRLFMAAAFAEAGEHEAAREIMREKKTVQKRDVLPRRPLRAQR